MSDRGPVILVVEDDQASRETLQSILEEIIGAKVVGTGDGEVGLRLAGEVHPDLILLDLRLPRLNGWEVLRRLKADPGSSTIPVVVITTATFPGDRERAQRAGCDDYLVKPFEIDDLEATARRYLGGLDG